MARTNTQLNNPGNDDAGLYSDAHFETYGYYEHDIQQDIDEQTRQELADLSSPVALRLRRRLQHLAAEHEMRRLKRRPVLTPMRLSHVGELCADVDGWLNFGYGR